jgi:hypothetical protein
MLNTAVNPSKRSYALLARLLCGLPLFYTSLLLAEQVVPRLQELRPTVIGVDRRDGLWAWSAETGRVTSLAPQVRHVEVDPQTFGVDADSLWGIATIGPSGSRLTVRDWNGGVKMSVTLLEPAASVCWIDRNHVAVSPRFGRHEIELWSIVDKRVASRFGELAPLDATTPGAQFARATHVRYDVQNDELIAFDAYRGTLHRYSREKGTIVSTAEIRHPRRESTDRWIAELDRQHKQQAQPFRPLVWSFPTIALDATATAWVVESSNESSATLVGIARNGKVSRKQVSSSCPGVRLVIWRDSFIFFRDPQSPLPYCMDERKMK